MGKRSALVAVPLLVAGLTGGASASTPASGPCSATLTQTPNGLFTSADLFCVDATAGGPGDDTGAYHFDFAPPLNCSSPSGTVAVFPRGPVSADPAATDETGLPGPATYTTELGAVLYFTFTDPVVEAVANPALPATASVSQETHNFTMRIDCADAAGNGSFSE
ncbi:MAG: hypothetical protein QOG34_1715 [Frankiaceae bacterium]|jgi:hypothetical protein|nr:hypothetical protein [Frankiaceae bacterium]